MDNNKLAEIKYDDKNSIYQKINDLKNELVSIEREKDDLTVILEYKESILKLYEDLSSRYSEPEKELYLKELSIDMGLNKPDIEVEIKVIKNKIDNCIKDIEESENKIESLYELFRKIKKSHIKERKIIILTDHKEPKVKFRRRKKNKDKGYSLKDKPDSSSYGNWG